jgi:hypothetical protein
MAKRTVADLDNRDSLYFTNTEEGFDLLEAAVDATHALHESEDIAQARHQSTQALMSGHGQMFDNSRKYWNMIKECIEVYWTTPTIRNIIDLMTDFASEGLKIEHRVDGQQRFYEEWARRSGFRALIPKIFHTLLLTGNCVVMRQEGKISPSTRTEMAKAALDKPKATKRTMPIGYTVLNPTRISFEKSELFNQRYVKFHLTDDDRAILKKPRSDHQREIKAGLPADFVQSALERGYVILDPDKITVLHYKKLPWANWAVPLIFSAIDDINFKKMLRKMDESSAADVIKAVIIFKLGKMEDGLPPDRKRFAKLASLLKKTSQAKNIIWDNLISVEDSFPPIEKILGKEKYEVVERDILSNFGVSQVLVSGEAGNYSSGFLSVRTLMEKLETLREDVLNEFVCPELDLLRRSVGFSKKPAVRFSSMSLRDEAAEKKLILEMVDRHLLDPRSAQEVMGFNPEIVAVRMEKARKDKRFKQLSPLDPPPPPKPGAGSPAKPKGQPGRPGGKKAPQTKKRSTKPKGVGLSSQYADQWIANVANICYDIFVEHGPELSQQASVVMVPLALHSLSYTEDLTEELVLEAIATSQGIIESGTDPTFSAKIEAILENL